MTITISEKIPFEKMNQFHEILCATGGRYIQNPIRLSDSYLVKYEAGDYASHQEAWRRCTTEITEVRRDQYWRTLIRKVIAIFY